MPTLDLKIIKTKSTVNARDKITILIVHVLATKDILFLQINRDRAIKIINGEFLLNYQSLTANLKNYRQLFLTQTPLGQAVSVHVCLQEMSVL